MNENERLNIGELLKSGEILSEVVRVLGDPDVEIFNGDRKELRRAALRNAERIQDLLFSFRNELQIYETDFGIGFKSNIFEEYKKLEAIDRQVVRKLVGIGPRLSVLEKKSVEAEKIADKVRKASDKFDRLEIVEKDFGSKYHSKLLMDAEGIENADIKGEKEGLEQLEAQLSRLTSVQQLVQEIEKKKDEIVGLKKEWKKYVDFRKGVEKEQQELEKIERGVKYIDRNIGSFIYSVRKFFRKIKDDCDGLQERIQVAKREYRGLFWKRLLAKGPGFALLIALVFVAFFFVSQNGTVTAKNQEIDMLKGKIVELEKAIRELDGKYGEIALKMNDMDVAVNGMNLRMEEMDNDIGKSIVEYVLNCEHRKHRGLP